MKILALKIILLFIEEFNAFKTNELRRNNMSLLPRLVVIYSSYDLPAINEIACHLATLILSSLICYCK